MSKAGGSSTITGVDFEAWFVALKFADAFFDKAMQVTPQAKTYIHPETHQTEIASMDDVHITSHSKHEFYNLKFRAPNIVSWRLSDLKHHKVFSQLKDQFQKTPNVKLYFVSQSDCPIFREILPRGAACSSREAIKIALQPNNYLNVWDDVVKELQFSDEQMIWFANQVNYKHIIDIEEIESLILQKLTGHVTKVGS